MILFLQPESDISYVSEQVDFFELHFMGNNILV
jgi:hypothetical protein